MPGEIELVDGDLGAPESFRHFEQVMQGILSISKAGSDAQMASERERNRLKRAKKKGSPPAAS